MTNANQYFSHDASLSALLGETVEPQPHADHQTEMPDGTEKRAILIFLV
jgi:hypothetical protein